MIDEEMRDFFLSFTWGDVEIATALNDALLAAGFTTWFHPLDKPRGAGIADWTEHALDASRQMIAVCSPSYFDPDKGYARAERQSMFWDDPTDTVARLILVKVEHCKIPRLIAQNEYIDLIGLKPTAAGKKLVVALQGEQARMHSAVAALQRRTTQRPAIFNVPGTVNEKFAGRESELVRLHELLQSRSTTAITAVKGIGGIGKTALAREYALRYGSAIRYGGVWWVDAETQSSIFASFETLSGQLDDVPRSADLTETAEAVRAWLGARPDNAPWLVVFDNAADAASITPFLPGGSAKVIVTSRFQHFDQIAAELNLDKWDDDTMMRYLLDRAGRGTEAEARSLAQKLDGLPLAAEQAGAFLAERRDLSFGFYESRLMELLSRNPSAPENRSVYATFAAAIEAVLDRAEGEAALAILNLCAFLSPDGVEVPMLVATAEQTEILPDPPRAALADDLKRSDALGALRSYGLMKDSSSETILLHRLMAQVARSRLPEAEQEGWASAGLLMIHALMPSGPVGGKGDPSADPSVWPLCATLTPHAIALAKHMNPGPGKPGEDLGYLLNQSAAYLNARGDFDGAIDLLRRRVDLSERIYKDRPEKQAIALSNLAGMLKEREEGWNEAEEYYKRALAIEEKVLESDDSSLAITFSNFGGLKWRQKDFIGAAELTERAADIWKAAHGDISVEYGTGLRNLGAIYSGWARETGDPALHQKEWDATTRAVEITRQVRGFRHPSTASDYNNLAVTYAYQSDMANAAENMARAVAIDLSLDLLSHPLCQQRIQNLFHFWSESEQIDKARRLSSGDAVDIAPFVVEIEQAHREWVAEDPASRNFGPPSPVTGAVE